MRRVPRTKAYVQGRQSALQKTSLRISPSGFDGVARYPGGHDDHRDGRKGQAPSILRAPEPRNRLLRASAFPGFTGTNAGRDGVATSDRPGTLSYQVTGLAGSCLL